MAAEFTRPASLYGAVDLGARKQALEAQARREAEEKSGRVPTVVEVTAATFSVDVVERSMGTPVVIEATVSRAEQVKQFSATLEKLAGEAGGGWVLARVDVERDPQLAQALRMRIVPTVFLAFQGQIMPLFEGPMPEAQVRQALQQVFQQLGVEVGRGAAPAQPPVDPDLAEAEAALAKGDLDTAEAAFTRLKEREPGNEDAKTGLARVALMRRVRGLDTADVLRRAAADEADVALQCQAADVEMLNGQAEQAFDRLVGVVRRTKGEERDKARVHLLGLFEMFPVSDPLVLKARRALASALF
ncbi:hypothetical protein TBS_23340 [Thermobispora bispora]|uniref:Thioredoxin domain-containing protein-like protein n=1 Tax=Thermobispora bispora (strain ATCC 19993 / DSM 43833 / CBS 139.67 / JCM 10125 / KCTC 9307 / NBRC 14880 / R51) TaxID=469371 RepID=D6Y750_THEBD|nr:tetratricopeptide repeat protein [Thermobispora bispora]ADG87645.1 Thioredoxin domain-containing protein-like protein [Thermobispora bispora DSM 43833]MBO2472982.1 co-chaperone YbbN [Actinomycetales bacterium]MDI9579857.1 tetratricopeptide repeat protein [Thermobispora sp.]QSI47560.1 co-chaperone YbbN [Thermobispora bispora]